MTFDEWCAEHGITERDKPAAFEKYIESETGWNGRESENPHE